MPLFTKDESDFVATGKVLGIQPGYLMLDVAHRLSYVLMVSDLNLRFM